MNIEKKNEIEKHVNVLNNKISQFKFYKIRK